MSFEIRDPIHEGIICSEEEKALINSPLVQRLKWVAQLSMVNQVYNGATHSRFSHSLGAMQIAGEYMTHLVGVDSCPPQLYIFQGFFIDLARVAGLLHDIGHGPFSHSFDHVVYKKIYHIDDGGHDLARVVLIQQDLLRRYLPREIGAEDLIKLWEPELFSKTHVRNLWAPHLSKTHVLGSLSEISKDVDYKPFYDIVRNIVEGPLGADRIDFTRRDSYNIGMTHLGTIPTSRIIQNSKIVKVEGVPRLSYHVKIIDDIIRTLDGRLSMYASVYLHKTSVAASILVEKMMECISEPFGLPGMTLSEDFLRLTDHKIFAMVSEWHEPLGTYENLPEIRLRKKAQKFYTDLMDRNLPKMDHEVHVSDFEKVYDEKEYADMWYPGKDPESFVIYKSRPISGISADKFDKYHIYFHDSHDKIFTCQELLDKIGYTVPIKPYYIVRGYSMPV